MPTIERIRNRVRILWQRLFRSGVTQLLTLFLFGSFGTVFGAQKVEIKLVDARSGLAVSHTCVDLGADHMGHMVSIPTDKDGVAHFYITDTDADVDTQKHWAECGNWGVIDPVVRCSDGFFGLHVGYVLCQYRKRDSSWLATMRFSTKEVLQQGIVMSNRCGKATASPKPGMVVIFVRPLSWWQGLWE